MDRKLHQDEKKQLDKKELKEQQNQNKLFVKQLTKDK